MKNLLPIALAAMLFGCAEDAGTDPATDSNSDENMQLIADYQQQIAEYEERDSILNDYLASFNEIEANLDQIKETHGFIVFSSANDPEFQTDVKTRIMEDINLLAELMADSRNKIALLSAELENSGIVIEELEKMIILQQQQLEAQHLEILKLEETLADLDQEFVELFEAYQDKSQLAEDQDAELNTAFFAYGSFKELKEAGVVTKEGGFIGIGAAKKLADDFTKEYFTKIDIREKTEIILASKSAELVTTHPADTYEIVGTDSAEKLVITDPVAFWSVSKYLVIIVD